jgi:hypothetical protein
LSGLTFISTTSNLDLWFFLQAREEQAFLEMKHRKEEDDLYRRFAKKREDEEKRMTHEFQDEWERELQVSHLSILFSC